MAPVTKQRCLQIASVTNYCKLYAYSTLPLLNVLLSLMPFILDIPQVVVLTKIDNICEETRDDTASAFRSKKVEKCVAKVNLFLHADI